MVAYASQNVFLGFIALACVLAQREFQAMAAPEQTGLECQAACAAGLGFVLLAGSGGFLNALLLLAATVLMLATLSLFRHQDIIRSSRELGLTLLGFCYLPVLLSLVVLLFARVDGRQWIFFVMLTVMLADTFAYFVGSAIGKTPLYPAVSPNKSWEGSLGGVAGSMLGGIVALLSFFPELGWFHALLASALLSVVGQTGDLFESLLKRSFQVKDSGNLIPGHGGLLDRLDSLLFAFPAAFFYATLFFGA